MAFDGDMAREDIVRFLREELARAEEVGEDTLVAAYRTAVRAYQLGHTDTLARLATDHNIHVQSSVHVRDNEPEQEEETP